MGIEVKWTRDLRTFEFNVEAEGDGVLIRIRTANLGYASQLTRLILDSTPRAFDFDPDACPAPTAASEAPYIPDASELPGPAFADADDAAPEMMSHEEAIAR